MVAGCWNGKRFILVKYLPGRTKVNSGCHVETLRSVNAGFCWVSPTRILSEVLHQHDNTSPHASVDTTNIITIWMGMLPHPSYISDLAPSGFHLFVPWKDSLQGHHYVAGVTLQNTVYQQLQRKENNCYWAGIYVLVQCGSRLLLKIGTVWKNNYVVKKFCGFFTCLICECG
jgi:hypothetical protein